MFIAYGDPTCGDEAVVSFYATGRIIMMSCWSHIMVVYFV